MCLDKPYPFPLGPQYSGSSLGSVCHGQTPTFHMLSLPIVSDHRRPPTTHPYAPSHPYELARPTTYSQRHEHGVPGEQAWNRRGGRVRRRRKNAAATAGCGNEQSVTQGSAAKMGAPSLQQAGPIPILFLVPPGQRPCFATPLAVLPPAHCTLQETAKWSTKARKESQVPGGLAKPPHSSTPPTYPSSIVCPSATHASPRSQARDFLLPLLPGTSGTFLPRSSL